ncbi:MAG: methyltransferase domain-containing protein [Deltaproteobacteria bacterium]|nr:methyltransferase domain-containing protein [Deltaproteobacteria bacterium]
MRLSGWINLDANSIPGVTDGVWDLKEGIPFENGSCKLIYCEHLLEHFSVEEGLFFLKECHRVLTDDGVVRIAMPSLDVLIRKSCEGNWREQEWLSWPEYSFIQTRAEMLNIAFRWWGHQWLYDLEELERRLREAGFRQVYSVGHGESDIPELRNLETRGDSLLICEARK